MTVEMKWGLIFCLVGAFLTYMLLVPLHDTSMVTAMWALGLFGGAVAFAAGLYLLIAGRAAPKA